MQSLKCALPRHAMCVVDRFKIEMGPHRNMGLDNVHDIKKQNTNSQIYEFKVLQNVSKMKKQGLKCFLKHLNK